MQRVITYNRIEPKHKAEMGKKKATKNKAKSKVKKNKKAMIAGVNT